MPVEEKTAVKNDSIIAFTLLALLFIVCIIFIISALVIVVFTSKEQVATFVSHLLLSFAQMAWMIFVACGAVIFYMRNSAAGTKISNALNEIEKTSKDSLIDNQKINNLKSELIQLHEQLTQEKQKRDQIKIDWQNSQNYLNNIINTIADPIFVKDDQHRWVVMNEAFCKFMGYPKSKLVGKSDYDFFSKEQSDVFRQKDAIVFSTMEENENEEKFTDAQGKLHTISTKKKAFSDDDGNKALVGVIRDITHYHDQIEISESLKEIMDNMGDGVVVVDNNQNFTIFNPAAERMFGDNFCGATIRQLMDKCDCFLSNEKSKCSIDDFPASRVVKGDIFNNVMMFLHSSAYPEGIWIVMTGRPIIDSDGIKGGVLVCRDYTEIKKAESELLKQQQNLEKKNEALIEANRHKSEFLANMSHELRTPLNAIIGYTSLSERELKGKISENHLNYLHRTSKASHILLQLINDVLDFSKIEAGHMDTFYEEFDFVNLVEDCVMTLEGIALDKGLKWKINFPKNLTIIKNDQHKMKQILTNILGNAIKFTEQGYISIHGKIVNKHLHVELSDTGCGMPENQLHSIFESFKQIDGSIKKRFGGTGLGMAITKKLCDLLNIKINVKSQLDIGTSFLLEIPINRNLQKLPLAEPVTTDSSTLMAISASKIKIAPVNPSDEKAYIICVTENQTFQDIKRYTSRLAFEVVHAKNFAEILQFTKNNYIWCIVVEPTEYGLKTLNQCKSEKKLQRIPVIMTSTDPERASVSLTVEWINTPINKDHLLESLLRINKLHHGTILIIDAEDTYSKTLQEVNYNVVTIDSASKIISYLKNEPLPVTILFNIFSEKVEGFEILVELGNHPLWQKIPVVVIADQEVTKEKQKLLDDKCKKWLHVEQISAEGLVQHVEMAIHSIEQLGIRSILVIDDNATNLELMREVLESAGYVIFQASSGKEGIEVAMRSRSDVILMDLAMPGMDGFETTQKLKEKSAIKNTVVIACSAFHTEDFRKKALESGCEGYIVKPIDPNLLVRQIKEITLSAQLKKAH